MDYDKIEGEMMGVLDLDKTGKVDTDDFKVLYDRVMKVRVTKPTIYQPFRSALYSSAASGVVNTTVLYDHATKIRPS